MKLLERYLTKVPMYLLTTAGLTLIILFGVVMAAVGQLSFSPLALFSSLATFLVAGVLSNVLLGKLYSLQPHIPSAIITGLILSCLFTPSLEPVRLAIYALVACVAQASKYVIAYKARHIFNPATIAAFIIGVMGMAHASWWVASPPMAIIVAVAGFLVLYKTRQLRTASLFLVVSAGILLLKGVPITTVVLSWPLLFLATFMLSEPLTLPPRRWQQLVVAIVVAILTTLPFSVGEFSSSPALALVIGNLLAFIVAFRQRKGLHLALAEVKDLTPTTKEIILTSATPLYFEPGQYVELTLMHPHTDMRGYRRSFSITSQPGEKELRLGVKFYEPSSSFKKALLSLPKGIEVQATGIYGDFVLPKDTNQKLLFIAGGIGITPFISHLGSLVGDERDIVLLYFVSSPDEIAYEKQLRKSGATVYTLINEQLSEEIIARYVQDAAERTAYISGPPTMVASAKSLLRGRAKSIKTDYFSGY